MIYYQNKKIILLYPNPCTSPEPCSFTQTNSTPWESWAVCNWQDVLTALDQLTSWQCCAAMRGAKHTEALPLCLPDSIPSLLGLQLVGQTQKSVDPTCSGSLMSGIPCSDQQERESSPSSETAKSLSVLKRFWGGPRKPVGPDGVLLPAGLQSRLRAFPDALKWRFIANLRAPGSSKVYEWQ